MKKAVTTIAFLAFALCTASAQTTLRLEARLDYMQEYQDGDKINDASGFKGKYLNIRLDGNISGSISYSYRQRLNKPNKEATFFDATDWITLTYKARNWAVSGGKQVVCIGGYEYDRAPIDVYFASEYWHHIACYQVGASGSYISDTGNDRLTFQFCESPFRKGSLNPGNKEMFAYNLMWTGTHDWFESLYSVNMIEYMPGRFINYISLGNRFMFGKFKVELDIMNRAASFRDFFGRDMSLVGDISWHPVDRLKIFAHLSHDFNTTDDPADLCVAPGTRITRLGGGLEYFPFKTYKDIRLHINGCYTFGTATENGALRHNQTIIDCGVTWFMNLLDLKRK